MNLIMKQQEAEKKNDFQRLIEICNSYGLNQEETTQIVSEFQRGTFVIQQQFSKHDDQSRSNQFYQSSSFQNETVRFDEQYSFKHNNVRHENSIPSCTDYHSPTPSNAPQEQNSMTIQHHQLQEYFANRVKFEKQIYQDLKTENQRLVEELKSKQQKISILMEMKQKDSETLSGLKDVIADLTRQSEDKQAKLVNLQNRYDKLLEHNEHKKTTLYIPSASKQNLNNLNKYINIDNQTLQSSKIIQQRKNLTESNAELHTNSSQPRLSKESSKNKMKQVGKEQFARRNNRIDISKYKGMIEDLRSSYHKVK